MAIRINRKSWLAALGIVLLTAGCAGSGGYGTLQVTLNGANEVPPVNTAATGFASFTIGEDRAVTGSVTTSGVIGTAAHIHEGAPGKNGPVIVPLEKSSDNTWAIKPGAKLDDAQFEAFKAGNLYVNVHSAANKGGEIRGQLKP